MQLTQTLLLNEISKLPIEKVDKALSFVRYLLQEPEQVLFIDSAEEAELYEILKSEDSIMSADILSMIKGLPND
ncbi:MAG: hypothetical protein LBC96_07380 [Lachnospiraceae bacterium]|jgi:hypothetical protein|nr:hypothetical protein [Lachnospiraceae bacterium]